MVLAVVVPALGAGEQTAAEAFGEGAKLLEAGDFAGALEAYTRAAGLEPENAEYRQQAALVKRVVAARELLDEMTDAQRWERTALGLHYFYHDHKVYGEALALDRKVHERLNSPVSAGLLARTCLVMDRNAEAVEVLRGREDTRTTPENAVLLGLALVREGEAEAAKALLSEMELPETPTAVLLFDSARLRAATGDTDGALKALSQSFEQTPPSRLAAVKAAAGEFPEFAGLVKTDAYAAALETKSVIQESRCSGGAGCGKCPSRTQCSSQQGGEKHPAGCAGEKKP
jgi:tetratricopeptide (TPR) repeat protein